MSMNKIERHAEICKTLNETYAKKNHDYGDSFGESFKKLGIISAITRLTDKMNRATTLALNNDPQVKDEKLEDTLLDLANYAVMTVIELERTIEAKEKEVTRPTHKPRLCSDCKSNEISTNEYPCAICAETNKDGYLDGFEEAENKNRYEDMEDFGDCGACKYVDIVTTAPLDDNGDVVVPKDSPCETCKNNFLSHSNEYDKADMNWEPVEEEEDRGLCVACKHFKNQWNTETCTHCKWTMHITKGDYKDCWEKKKKKEDR